MTVVPAERCSRLIKFLFTKQMRKEGRNPDHNLCPVGKAVSRTFLTALRPWPKADAEKLPSELGCERCAMLAEEPAMAGETMVIILII